MIPEGKRMWRLAAIGIMLLALAVVGCAGSKTRAGASSSAQKDKGPMALYYDFGDVLVPSELKVDRNASFVFRTPEFSAGVLALRGRVEINSLSDFFYNNMTKDNWKMVSFFKSRRTIMLFSKENRWCVINITEADFTTYTEIWVSPNTMETGSERGVDPAGGLFK